MGFFDDSTLYIFLLNDKIKIYPATKLDKTLTKYVNKSPKQQLTIKKL